MTIPKTTTIEILSPDQRPTKVIGNILHCLNYGTSLGWLLDPDECSVLVYPPKQQQGSLKKIHICLKM